jgi:hypothetical protein
MMFEQIDLWHWLAVALGVLLAVSEALPFSEKIKANSVFQLVMNGAKKVLEFLRKSITF